MLFSKIDRKQYILSSDESGLRIGKKDNLGIDLAIFEKKNIEKLSGEYFKISVWTNLLMA